MCCIKKENKQEEQREKEREREKKRDNEVVKEKVVGGYKTGGLGWLGSLCSANR